MREKIFYFLSGGFLCGVLFSSYVSISSLFLLFIFCISLGIFLFLYTRAKSRGREERHPFYILCFITLLFFILGISRLDFAENRLANSPLVSYEGKNISAIGIIIDEPARKNDTDTFRLKTYALSRGTSTPTQISPSYILLHAPFYENFSYGDKIIAKGPLEKIENFQADDGNFFDYVSYLKKDGVSYQMQRPEVVLVSKSEGNPIVLVLLSAKRWFIENISQNLGEPDAALASGMVISGKGALDKDLQNDFIKAGIIHVVVLSGYNVAIVIAVLLSIFSSLGRGIKIGAVSFGVFLFVIMSGGSAPVVRSAIMALIVLLSKNSSRQAGAFRVLILSAFFMVLWNPFILAFDPSFGLSFLATFAVIVVAPILKTRLLFIPDKHKMREIVSETLGTQIFLLPYLIYKMGIFSLVALPVNILILPLVPVIMFLGFFIGIFGWIFYLAYPFAFAAHLLISLMLFIVKIFIEIPFSSISISHVPLYIPLILYAVFLVIFIRLKGFRVAV